MSNFGKVAVVPRGVRNDAEVERFSELSSSVAAPVEVCGLGGQLALLRRLRCDDGSNPFASDGQAHSARLAATPGGRCGMHVDAYEVACPEDRYQVYLDMYVCLADELRGQKLEPARFTVAGASVLVPAGWYLVASAQEPLTVALASEHGRLVVAAAQGGGEIRERLSAALGLPVASLPELTPGQQVVERVHGDQLLAVARGDRSSAGGLRWYAALAGPDADFEIQRARELLGRIAAESGVSGHEIVAYASLAPAAAVEVPVVREEVDGRGYFFPHGWQAALAGDTFMARLPVGDDELRFLRQETDAGERRDRDLELTAMRGLQSSPGDATVIIAREFLQPGDFRLVADDGAVRKLVATRYVGDRFVLYLLIGDKDQLDAHHGVALFETLIHAYDSGEP